MSVRQRFAPVLTAIFLVATAHFASAVVLDWSVQTWNPGALSKSFDADPSSAGNDVTVTMGGDTNKFKPDPTTGLQTPTIDSTMQGGQTPVRPSLDLAMKITTPNFISVTVSFSPQYTQGVDTVSFSIFGINLGLGTGTITNITGLGIDGSTLVAPVISNLGANVQLSGTGLNQVLTGIGNSPNGGPGSDGGNATITFNGTPTAVSLSLTKMDKPAPGIPDWGL